MNPERRKFLQYLLVSMEMAVIPTAQGAWLNPCFRQLPEKLAQHPLVKSAWQGINPAEVWDTHAHIAGIGDAASGIYHTHEMDSLWHPIQYLQHKFYLNAGCTEKGRVDHSYVERLQQVTAELNAVANPAGESKKTGAKLLLFAFEQAHDEQGRVMTGRTAFHVPNAYAQAVAQAHPQYFEWVCSIHPYRADARDELERAVAHGARAVKWLPSAMGIEPSSPKCDAFYRSLARHNMLLISHAGEEKAVDGMGMHQANNPLRLRRAMDMGVRVVIAHCASIGEDVDLDQGEHGPHVPSFELFSRLMGHPQYKQQLFGDISAVVLRNRSTDTVRAIIEQQDWHGRLLNGSDYPLVGVLPLFSLQKLANVGLLQEELIPLLEEIQQYNPLLFDFVLKRNLRAGRQQLAGSIFQTRDFFVGRK